MRFILSVFLVSMFVSPLTTLSNTENKINENKISEKTEITNEKTGFILEPLEACSTSNVKTYMPYDLVTDPSSKQYHFIRDLMTINEETGLLYDEYGFIGVALGSYYGEIGSRYLITLDTGVILPIVKVDAKADIHTINGCYQMYDKSVIEFVIDVKKAGEYFGIGGNGLIVNGNFNNITEYSGAIIEIQKVTIPENFGKDDTEYKEIINTYYIT